MILIVLARVIIAVALFCAPIVFFIVGSGNPENWMWIIIPVFAVLPAIAGAVLVFLPIEIYLDARGLAHRKNFLVPLAGGTLIFIFLIVTSIMWGDAGSLIQRFSNLQNLALLALFSVAGVIWGLCWRLTEWLGKKVGFFNE